MATLEFVDPALLPFLGAFLFVFAIVFGLLSYAKMFGFPRNVNAAIALVFGIFAASFEPFRTGLFVVLPILVIPLVILFFLVFLKKIFTKKKDEEFDALPPAVTLGVSLILLGVLWPQLNIQTEFISSANILWLIGIVLVLLIFLTVYYDAFKPTPT